MKIQMEVTKTEEREINFPHYVKYAGKLIKITSSENFIEVGSIYATIGIQTFTGLVKCASRYMSDGEPIPEQEFNEAYDESLRVLFKNRPYGKINLEQSFSDFKKTLDVHIPKGPEDYINVPTNDRYDTIPLNTLDTRYGTKEVNQFIP